MSCSHYQEAIALRAGGDLPEVQLAAVEAHLDECLECAQLARELEQTRARLAALRTRGVTPERLASVRAAVWAHLDKARSTDDARLGPRLAPAALAMAAMLALAVGLAVFWLARRSVSEAEAPSALVASSSPPPASQAPPRKAPLTLPLAPPSARLVEETMSSVAPPAPTAGQAPTPARPPQLAAASAEPASIPASPRRAIRPATTFTPPTISPRQPVTKSPQGQLRVASAQGLRIQLVSDDESVVIYWLVDPEEISDETSD